MARQLWLSLLIGGIFVGLLEFLGRHNLATPVPFLLLLPGILAGTATPGSGFELKEDHPLSPLATIVFYAVNVAIYGGLAYLLLKRSSSPKVSPPDR
jgi:hypothetical protein